MKRFSGESDEQFWQRKVSAIQGILAFIFLVIVAMCVVSLLVAQTIHDIKQLFR